MSILESAGTKQIWTSFVKAVGADLREVQTIRGASGLDHQVQALAVDEVGRRVVIVSAEASPRIAALTQVDVQASMPDVRVIVARPIIIDLGVLSRRLLAPLDVPKIEVAALTDFTQRFNSLSKEGQQQEMNVYLGEALAPVLSAWKNAALPTFTQLMDIVNQASYLDWKSIAGQITEKSADGVIDLSSLYNIDNTAIDRQYGICPVPLYEFAEADWDLLLAEGRNEELVERLKQLDIYQYFYPSPDHLALGMVDQGAIDESQILRAIQGTPALGHPLSPPELITQLAQIPDILAALKDSGYVAEGEMGLEVSPAGMTVRSTMKYRPREGLVSKVLSRFNVNLSASPKDFMPPS